MLRKKRFDHDVCGVSPEAGSESMVGKICEDYYIFLCVKPPKVFDYTDVR